MCLTNPRMYEAFMDPKTWLFALFAALDNVPNSLTNQTAIIITEFGFSNLQTTLLGCVGGVVEILTIFTGVKIASRIPNSRAWVGIIYFIPNIMGCLLVSLLPWSHKVGLLFSVWLTGTWSLPSLDLMPKSSPCISQVLGRLDLCWRLPGSVKQLPAILRRSRPTPSCSLLIASATPLVLSCGRQSTSPGEPRLAAHHLSLKVSTCPM